MAKTQKLVKIFSILLFLSLGLTLALTPVADNNPTYNNVPPNSDASNFSWSAIKPELQVNALTIKNNQEKDNNVIVILADDLDWETFNTIPDLFNLKQQSVVFNNHVVTDSLCCPSRSSILTGLYVKNHKVYSNVYETGGGWGKFKQENHHKNNIATDIKKQDKEIETLFIGKYLNQYTENKKQPGWDTFVTPITPGNAYKGYGYTLSINGKAKKYGFKNSHYLNTVLTNHAVKAIKENKNKQFFLFYSSFLPHSPYEARKTSKGLYKKTSKLTTNPDFNITPVNPPRWLQKHDKLTNKQLKKLEIKKEKRLESTHTLGEDVMRILKELKKQNIDHKTTIIITSDNGYHLGNRQLPAGKRTPYYHDTVVPLLVIHPNNGKSREENRITSGVDLVPTILDLLSLEEKRPTDGVSFRNLVEEKPIKQWRTWVLTETNSKNSKNDPDYTKYAPETFKALRSSKWVYIVYDNGEKELYDIRQDPYETTNIIKTVDPRLQQALHSKWQEMILCKEKSCILY